MRCVMRPSADPRRTAEPALRGRPQAAARGAHAAGRLARAGGAVTVRALPRRGRRAAEPLARQARAARAAAPARGGAGSPPWHPCMGAWVPGRAGTAVCGPGCERTLGALWATGPSRMQGFSSSEAASAHGLCCACAPGLPACVRLDWCGLACSRAAALLEMARAARLPPAGARGRAAAAAGRALRRGRGTWLMRSAAPCGRCADWGAPPGRRARRGGCCRTSRRWRRGCTRWSASWPPCRHARRRLPAPAACVRRAAGARGSSISSLDGRGDVCLTVVMRFVRVTRMSSP